MVGTEITFMFGFWTDLVKKAQEQNMETWDRRLPETQSIAPGWWDGIYLSRINCRPREKRYLNYWSGGGAKGCFVAVQLFYSGRSECCSSVSEHKYIQYYWHEGNEGMINIGDVSSFFFYNCRINLFWELNLMLARIVNNLLISLSHISYAFYLTLYFIWYLPIVSGQSNCKMSQENRVCKDNTFVSLRTCLL